MWETVSKRKSQKPLQFLCSLILVPSSAAVTCLVASSLSLCGDGSRSFACEVFSAGSGIAPLHLPDHCGQPQPAVWPVFPRRRRHVGRDHCARAPRRAGGSGRGEAGAARAPIAATAQPRIATGTAETRRRWLCSQHSVAAALARPPLRCHRAPLGAATARQLPSLSRARRGRGRTHGRALPFPAASAPRRAAQGRGAHAEGKRVSRQRGNNGSRGTA